MRFTKQTIYYFIMGCSFLFILNSCYRMPDEDEFSVVPTTNNPAVTYEKNDNFMPSVGY